jgi:hypothetical protein
MDKYFCKECLGLWQKEKFMLCCPGCVAHRDAGWEPKTLLSVYGPMFQVADRAYFPSLSRVFPPPSRTKPQHIKPQTYIWLKNSNFLTGFKEQQTEFLTKYERNGQLDFWYALDPSVHQYNQNLIF